MSTPQLVLSPMAGVTDAPTRFIAIENGADQAISEMITSQSQFWDSDKSRWRFKNATSEMTSVIQIAGADPIDIASAAAYVAEQGATAVEINMGCPAKKVCNVLAGSALLKDEPLVEEIIKAAVQAVAIPIYLKTRLGWSEEHKNIANIAAIAEYNGIQRLTIHGRTREQLYKGAASYQLIRQVKRQLKIPVFANGDITTPEKARAVLDYTGCDGLYIGRGALGQPWLFGQIRDYLQTGGYAIKADKDELKEIIFQHIKLIHEHYGEYMGVRIARKHLKWYLQNNVIFAADHFSQFAALERSDAQLDFIWRL